MSKVFVSMGMSLDGCVEGPNASLENMGGDGWGDLHAWLFQQRVFRQKLNLGEGGETGPDNRFLEETFDRTGVSIMGKRMFDARREELARGAAVPHAGLRRHARGSRAVGAQGRDDVPLRQRGDRGRPPPRPGGLRRQGRPDLRGGEPRRPVPERGRRRRARALRGAHVPRRESVCSTGSIGAPSVSRSSRCWPRRRSRIFATP